MQTEKTVMPAEKKNATPGWLFAIGISAAGLALSCGLWSNLQSGKPEPKASTEHQAVSSVQVDADSSTAQQIRVVHASTRPPLIRFSVGGSVEPNQKRVQQITPLAIGRVQSILISTGSKVQKGDLIAIIDSPMVAELHGKLHEAETRLALAKSQLERVTEAANRVNILKAKATLDEAIANYKRDEYLAALGATTRKDLLASESNFRRAQADYDFQNNISLNTEVAQANAELSTADAEVEHLKDGLIALDSSVNMKSEDKDHDIARIELRSPMTGTVLERLANPGSGVDVGKPLATIADTSSIWVWANVPEGQMSQVAKDMPVAVEIEGHPYNGRVNYIDPRITEDTRTGRVRIEIQNLKKTIATGAFAQIEFKRPDIDRKARVYVPEGAIQDIDGENVVFVKTCSTTPGAESFAMRRVQIGPRCCKLVPVYSGLTTKDEIAENGSFVLKSKFLKDKMGDSNS